jgi:hypothetical protein
VASSGARRLCQLASSAATAYPSLTAYSGYPLLDDAASWRAPHAPAGFTEA